MALTNTAKANLFKMIFGQSSSNTLLGTCYLGLSTTEPATDGSNFTEPASSTGYARSLLGQSSTPNTYLMGTTTSFTEENTSIIYFPEATSTWGTVTHWGLFTSQSGGTPLFYGELTTPVEVPANYVPLFRTQAFTMTIN
jgi:hypothetical protein